MVIILLKNKIIFQHQLLGVYVILQE